MAPIYPAGEKPLEGVSSERLVEAIARHGHQDVALATDRQALAQELAAEAREGDVIITLGAGDINRLLGEIEGQLTGGATS